MWQNLVFPSYLAFTLILRVSGQKFSATVAEENQTIPVYFYTSDTTATTHSLNCLSKWDSPTPQPVLSWDVTNAPTAIEGMDYVKSNSSVSDGILWLSFLRLSSNLTGTYACVAVGPNATSYTNFDVFVSDGSLGTGAIVGIVTASLILAIGATYVAIRAAKRLGYISM